jgi:hypothetical protein
MPIGDRPAREHPLMFRFRPPMPGPRGPVAPQAVAELCERLLGPAHFFARKGIDLRWERATAEDVSWEIFHGRLLDPARTRQRVVFTSWNVFLAQPSEAAAVTEPLLSLKLDAAGGVLYVVRGLECYAWEGYDAGDNVILSRERRKWVRELTGTIRLEHFNDLSDVEDEIACQLFRAVVGASRLPLASVEAPHPLYSFGDLFYCYRPWTDAGPIRSWQELAAFLLHPEVSWREQASVMETVLHNVTLAEMPAAAEWWLKNSPEQTFAAHDLARLLRTLFNEVSLSPWTDLVEKTLAFVRALEATRNVDTATRIDFLAHLLRQTGRHLTAYDLVTFHYRGANYPDALLLDAVLKEYLHSIEAHHELFTPSPDDDARQERRKRLRRRALRQGYLLRRQYEGHPVPDQPTSPGENSRVLPESHPRVPEDQILEPRQRRRLLYDGDPLPALLGQTAHEVLRLSFSDLTHAEERRELGLGLFIDRPFGDGKHPAEPDATLLLSSLAYSRSIAEDRLRRLARELGYTEDSPEILGLALQLDFSGLPVDAIGEGAHPGVVTLADARRASADFVFLHTTRSSVDALLEMFDFTALADRYDLDCLLKRKQGLVARRKGDPGICIYDHDWQLRLELMVPGREGFVCRAGLEYPAEGLLVVGEKSPEGIIPTKAPRD